MKEILKDIFSDWEQIDLRFRKGILKNLIIDVPNIKKIDQKFSEKEGNIVQLPFHSQEKTGYCWLIAVLNCIASFTCQKYNLPKISFSKNYLIFFDKIEKANWFLEHILSTLLEEEGSRTICYLLDHASSDRGQWQMAQNLIQKYGLVPGEIMTDAEATCNTKELNVCLSMLLRNDAAQLRMLYKSGTEISILKEEKERMFQEVLSILYSCFGIPSNRMECPNEIAKGQERVMTPKEFYQNYINFPFDEYISLYNDGEYSQMKYCIDKISLDGNVVGGEVNTFMHVTEDIFFTAMEKQVRENGYCWFGCDSGKFFFKNLHIYDDTSVNLSRFSSSLCKPIAKSVINMYNIASLTHALIIQQKEEIEGQYWWKGLDSAMDSEEVGGKIYISDYWISQYGFQAVVKKKYLPLNVQQNVYRIQMPWEFFNFT